MIKSFVVFPATDAPPLAKHKWKSKIVACIACSTSLQKVGDIMTLLLRCLCRRMLQVVRVICNNSIDGSDDSQQVSDLNWKCHGASPAIGPARVCATHELNVDCSDPGFARFETHHPRMDAGVWACTPWAVWVHIRNVFWELHLPNLSDISIEKENELNMSLPTMKQ